MIYELATRIHMSHKHRWVDRTGEYDPSKIDGYDVFMNVRMDILNGYMNPGEDKHLISALIRILDFIYVSGISPEIAGANGEEITDFVSYQTTIRKEFNDRSIRPTPALFNKYFELIETFIRDNEDFEPLIEIITGVIGLTTCDVLAEIADQIINPLDGQSYLAVREAGSTH